MASAHMEEKPASSLEKGPNNDQQLERIATVDVDNYHGIDLRTILVYVVRAILCQSIGTALTSCRLFVSYTLYSFSMSLDRAQ